MTPQEELQKELDDKRLERERVEVRLGELDAEIKLMERLQLRMFGSRGGPQHMGKKADWKDVQEAVWKALREAPPEGLTAAELSKQVPRGQETLKAWLFQQTKKKNIVRVSRGRFRAPRLESIPDTERGAP